MRKKTMLAGLVLLAAAAAAGLRWRGVRGERERFDTVRVARGDLTVAIAATGVAQPQNRLEIKPPIPGRADEILVKEGQTVRKGQVLAWMSSSERAALLDAARSKGPAELARWEELYKPTPLIAPLDGFVISRDVEPGQSVTAQDAVLVMSNRLIVLAQVDETDIGRVSVGQAAEITLDAYPERPLRARVDHVAFEAKTVNNVTIYEVDVVPARVPEFMRSGMTANVSFVIARRENALLLPAEAVRTGERRALVLVPGADGGKPERRRVEAGVSDGQSIEIVDGLTEGDAVLVRSFKLPERAKGMDSPFSPFGGRGGGGRSGRGGAAGAGGGRGSGRGGG